MKMTSKQLLKLMVLLTILLGKDVSANFQMTALKKDSSIYQKNYLKFSPFNFVPLHLMPCIALDFEHRHNKSISSQLTAGLFIANDANINRFPGFKAAYEFRGYLNKQEEAKIYFAYNSTFISQNGMVDLQFSRFNNNDTAKPVHNYNESFVIHRDCFIHSMKFGVLISLNKKLALDAYMGLGIIQGHNIYYNKHPEDEMISVRANPFALTRVEGNFTSINFPWNIKLCYKL